MECWHLTISTVTRLPIARSEDARTTIVRTLVRVMGPRLVLFSIVDDHVHVVAMCPRSLIGRVRTSLCLALRPVVDAPFHLPHTRPVHGRRHLDWLVTYLLTQTAKHGLKQTHPARWSGSCFFDLVGARHVPGWEPRLFELLPRVDVAAILRIAGMRDEGLKPATNNTMRRLGASKILEVASSAVAAGPTLVGRTAEVVRARRTAAQLGATVGTANDEMAWALQTTHRHLRRLRAGAPDELAIHAARVHASLLATSLEEVAPPQASSFKTAS